MSKVVRLKKSDLDIGYVVKIKSREEIIAFQEEYFEIKYGWNPAMDELHGKSFKITGFDGDRILGCNSRWSISPDMVTIDYPATLEFLKKQLSKDDTHMYAKEDDSTFYFIFSDGTTHEEENTGSDFDLKLFESANFFTSKEAAQKVRAEQQLQRELQRFSEENGGEDIDVANYDQAKYYILANYKKSSLTTIPAFRDIPCGTVLFISREVAEQAIEKFETQLTEVYL